MESGLTIESLGPETVEMRVGHTEMPFDDFGFANAEPVLIDSISVEYQGVGVARRATVRLTPVEIDSNSEHSQIVAAVDDTLEMSAGGVITLSESAAARFDPSVIAGLTLDNLVEAEMVPTMAWVRIAS
ncbi:hypothetical protein CIK65_19035 [Brevibacterium aurantiacum]|uniref:Uncharacterized protein n=2 Tax=Brevibacterium aurantiacum TaxID=273384 RepID=A0A2A3YPA1_BREAU|nr:hypothetical protein CIK65_19035 [Brevibacterium aurantiacum]